jgi:phosphoribosylformimino-5-aminoimidazole carboxamide ribotide isomerase
VDIARAFREHFGFDELYLADLDAIGGQTPALHLYDALKADGFRLWVDAGLRHAAHATPLLEHGVDNLIVGLETCSGPTMLVELLAQRANLVFSLDLKGGQALAAPGAWPEGDPFAIAAGVMALGVRRLLVLDLAQVGVGAGVGTELLCRSLRASYPELELAAGGGVRGPEDVDVMADSGVDWLLVASALHDGRLSRESLHARNSHVAD